MPIITLLSYNIKAGRHHLDSLEVIARVIEVIDLDIVTVQVAQLGV